MSNDKLFAYLSALWEELKVDNLEDEVLNYLYLAPLVERLSIHRVEYDYRMPLELSLTQKNQRDILTFRPHFDAMLTSKGIASLTICQFPSSFGVRASGDIKNRFIQELEDIQEARGVLNALLTLRNWAFFPSQEKGAKNRSRLAQSYLGIVLSYLEYHLKGDTEIWRFLTWCRKRTRKVFPFGFQEGKLRTPSKSALPIYKDEAASYIKYFLETSNDSGSALRQQFAEMVVYLSLCFACARHQSRYFAPADILRVTKDHIIEIQEILLTTNTGHFDTSMDVREHSKSSKKIDAHSALQLGVSSDFLLDPVLWPESSASQLQLSHFNPFCKAIRVRGRNVTISLSLNRALEIMDRFSISYKNVENRLNDAYESIGLSQSSGGIAPRCFLFNPHHWPHVDVRKNWESASAIEIEKS